MDGSLDTHCQASLGPGGGLNPDPVCQAMGQLKQDPDLAVGLWSRTLPISSQVSADQRCMW